MNTMNTAREFIALLVLAATVLIQQGCSSSGFDQYEPIPRGWTVSLSDEADKSGVAPHSIEIDIHIASGQEDPEERFPCARIDLDYGNGSGWQDVTSATHSQGDSLPLQVGQVTHTYTEPGQYILRTRITWWDGKIEIQPNEQDITYMLATDKDPYITVTAPE